MKVTVKPLRWQRFNLSPVMAAEGPGCRYSAKQVKSGRWKLTTPYRVSYHATDTAAQAAAQRLHDKMILSCLEVEP